MKTISKVLFAILTYFALTVFAGGGGNKERNCPSKTFSTMNGFDLKKFENFWYIQEMQLTPYFPRNHYNCAAQNWTMNQDKLTMSTYSRYSDNSGKVNTRKLSYPAIIRNSANPSQITMSLESGEEPHQKGQSTEFWVLEASENGGTYEWVVAIGGKPFGENDKKECSSTGMAPEEELQQVGVGLWLLTRSANPPDDHIEAMKAVLTKMNLDQGVLNKVEQKDCPFGKMNQKSKKKEIEKRSKINIFKRNSPDDIISTHGAGNTTSTNRVSSSANTDTSLDGNEQSLEHPSGTGEDSHVVVQPGAQPGEVWSLSGDEGAAGVDTADAQLSPPEVTTHDPNVELPANTSSTDAEGTTHDSTEPSSFQPNEASDDSGTNYAAHPQYWSLAEYSGAAHVSVPDTDARRIPVASNPEVLDPSAHPVEADPNVPVSNAEITEPTADGFHQAPVTPSEDVASQPSIQDPEGTVVHHEYQPEQPVEYTEDPSNLHAAVIDQPEGGYSPVSQPRVGNRKRSIPQIPFNNHPDGDPEIFMLKPPSHSEGKPTNERLKKREEQSETEKIPKIPFNNHPDGDPSIFFLNYRKPE